MNPMPESYGGKTLLIGIDDTDNLISRGTGFRARQLGELIESGDFGKLRGITRHQLLVDPAIPYTSHNSSACLEVETVDENVHKIVELAENYIEIFSAPGSDAGICIVDSEMIDSQIVYFGRSAKIRVLSMHDALTISHGNVIVHKGLTGDHGGIIGALAAVGLRKSGNDGIFIWSSNVRELTGIHTASWIKRETGIEEVLSSSLKKVNDDDLIDVGPWPRPVLLNGRVTLLVDRVLEEDSVEWRVAPKEYIKKF